MCHVSSLQVKLRECGNFYSIVWYREAEVQERVYVYRHHSGVSKVLAVTFPCEHCVIMCVSGGGRLVWPSQSHLRHHPVPDACLRGPDLPLWPGPLPVRGHIRGPGGPLVLWLLPCGARDQPGGARPPRPREAQSGQRDRDWWRGEHRALGHGAERHSQVSDDLFLILLDCKMASYEVNQSSYSAEIASQYLISPELKVKCWSGCSQPHCTLFSMHISKSCLEQFDKRIYNTRNFVRVLYLLRILKRCNFSQHRAGAKVRWPESGPTKFYCCCCNFHKNAFYLMLWHPDD